MEKISFVLKSDFHSIRGRCDLCGGDTGKDSNVECFADVDGERLVACKQCVYSDDVRERIIDYANRLHDHAEFVSQFADIADLPAPFEFELAERRAEVEWRRCDSI